MLGQFAEAEARPAPAPRRCPARRLPCSCGWASRCSSRGGTPMRCPPCGRRLRSLRRTRTVISTWAARSRSPAMRPARAEHFQTALRIAPGHVEAAFNLGVIALERDELDEARQWFEQVLARSPQYVDALISLGIVLQKQSRLDEAAARLREALALAPANAAARNDLARTLALQGRPGEAREHYLAALRVAPDFVAAHEGLASVCLALGRVNEAIEPSAGDARGRARQSQCPAGAGERVVRSRSIGRGRGGRAARPCAGACRRGGPCHARQPLPRARRPRPGDRHARVGIRANRRERAARHARLPVAACVRLEEMGDGLGPDGAGPRARRRARQPVLAPVRADHRPRSNSPTRAAGPKRASAPCAGRATAGHSRAPASAPARRLSVLRPAGARRRIPDRRGAGAPRPGALRDLRLFPRSGRPERDAAAPARGVRAFRRHRPGAG